MSAVRREGAVRGSEPAAREAAQSPCVGCPWLTANHGRKPDPDGWYTAANLKRLWAGLRTGEAPGMSCHPTDPRNPVSPAQAAAGGKAAPEHSVMRECAGSVIVQQREMQRFQNVDGDFTAYRRGNPLAMTRHALFAFGMRLAIQLPGELGLRLDHDLLEPVGRPGVDTSTAAAARAHMEPSS